MNIKKWPRNVRRFFSLNKKQLKDNNSSDGTNDQGATSSAAAANKQKNALVWSPEDIFDELNGQPIPEEMLGSVLLVEVGGGVDRGWVLDFSGTSDEDGNKILTTRYDLPEGRIKSKKAPSGPPSGKYALRSTSTSTSESTEYHLKALPWLWYKDRKTFSKIETGKLSDMVAFVTGRVAISGKQDVWNGIEQAWNEAKERVTERRKNLKVEGGDAGGEGDDDEQGGSDDDSDDEEEEGNEEAKIIATYKPDVEPMDPRTKEFWKRHFGTDFLVAAYLFLISSFSYQVLTYVKASKNPTPHAFVNATAATLWTLASMYFVKLSYPETIMLMAYHVMSIDPASMTFIERYFTANEMLIALWLFTLGFVIPNSFLVLYEFFITQNHHQAAIDAIITIVVIPLTGILNLSAMPDAMRANNGRGSSFFFDNVWGPLLCLKQGGERMAFWVKHLGNDALAGAWIFASLGILGGIGVVVLIIMHPLVASSWFGFWTTMPFSIGSVLLVRASYPENMNTSVFFSNDDDDGDDDDDGKNDKNGEKTPLLS
jgi:hypothetical protein